MTESEIIAGAGYVENNGHPPLSFAKPIDDLLTFLGQEETGEWVVYILDQDGDELAVETFDDLLVAIDFAPKFAGRITAEEI